MSTKSESSLFGDIQPLSSTFRPARTQSLTSLTQPEVDDVTETDTWRLNGEPLSSVVQRVMAVTGGDCVPHPANVISNKTGRKSDGACSPLVVKNNSDVTPVDFKRHWKQTGLLVYETTSSTVMQSSTGSDVISNGSSNGDKSCADKRYVDFPTATSEYSYSDGLPRRTDLNRVSDGLWPCTLPNIPGDVVHDSGNTHVRVNPYSRQKMYSLCEKQCTASTKLIDIHANEHDSPSHGTSRDSDVIKMADAMLPPRSSSSQVASARATPEVEIIENDVTGRRSSEEQRVDQRRPHCFRSRGDNENRMRTYVETRQLGWKNVEGEMKWRLGTTRNVWKSPTITTTKNSTAARKPMSRELLLDGRGSDGNKQQRPRGSEVVGDDGTGSGAATVTWRYLRLPPRVNTDRVKARRHRSQSPLRRVTLTKRYKLVVLTIRDECILIFSPQEVSSEQVDASMCSEVKTSSVGEDFQTSTNCARMHESLPVASNTNSTAFTSAHTSSSLSGSASDMETHDTVPDDLRGDRRAVTAVSVERINTWTNSPELQALSLNQTIEKGTSPCQTSSLSTIDSSSECSKANQGSVISCTSRTADVDHLISSLFDVAATDDDKPDVESLSMPASDRQDQSTSDGDKPEGRNDDVTDDVTITSLSATDDDRRCIDEPRDRKRVSCGSGDVITASAVPSDQQLEMSRSSGCSVGDDRSFDESRDDDGTGSELTKNSTSEHDCQSSPADTDRVSCSRDSADRHGCDQVSRDQRSTGSHVARPDVTSRRGNVDIYEEKVFVESLASSIGKDGLNLLIT